VRIKMSYLFQIIETESQPVLSVKTATSIGEMPKLVGSIYGSIVNYIIEKGEEPVGPEFTAYYNMDMENLIVEIGFPLQSEIEGQGDIELRYIPGGKKATGFYKGAYDKIGPVYEKLAAWLSQKGFESSGVAYEYYYNSPQDVSESELLTKIEILLK
jgi:effector-binding domain-containing protein